MVKSLKCTFTCLSLVSMKSAHQTFLHTKPICYSWHEIELASLRDWGSVFADSTLVVRRAQGGLEGWAAAASGSGREPEVQGVSSRQPPSDANALNNNLNRSAINICKPARRAEWLTTSSTWIGGERQTNPVGNLLYSDWNNKACAFLSSLGIQIGGAQIQIQVPVSRFFPPENQRLRN